MRVSMPASIRSQEASRRDDPHGRGQVKGPTNLARQSSSSGGVARACRQAKDDPPGFLEPPEALVPARSRGHEGSARHNRKVSGRRTLAAPASACSHARADQVVSEGRPATAAQSLRSHCASIHNPACTTEALLCLSGTPASVLARAGTDAYECCKLPRSDWEKQAPAMLCVALGVEGSLMTPGRRRRLSDKGDRNTHSAICARPMHPTL